MHISTPAKEHTPRGGGGGTGTGGGIGSNGGGGGSGGALSRSHAYAHADLGPSNSMRSVFEESGGRVGHAAGFGVTGTFPNYSARDPVATSASTSASVEDAEKTISNAMLAILANRRGGASGSGATGKRGPHHDGEEEEDAKPLTFRRATEETLQRLGSMPRLSMYPDVAATGSPHDDSPSKGDPIATGSSPAAPAQAAVESTQRSRRATMRGLMPEVPVGGGGGSANRRSIIDARNRTKKMSFHIPSVAEEES